MREDKRYTQANKEAVISLILGVLFIVWWYLFAYGLGDRPVEDYSYIMGLPAWLFYSSVLGFVVFSFAAWLVIEKFFKDIPLNDATSSEEDTNLSTSSTKDIGV